MITITNVLIGRSESNLREKKNHLNLKRNFIVENEELKEIYRRRILRLATNMHGDVFVDLYSKELIK